MRLQSWMHLCLISIILITGILIIITTIVLQNINMQILDHPIKLIEKKDWHDWVAISLECRRIGLGEQGEAATLDNNNTDSVLQQKLFDQHGLNALLSDAISVNRSISDGRNEGCLRKKYLAKLPSVSIVIPFHNELFSTFARTLHSIINRTPPELLQEIILVDDFSDIKFFAKLENYVLQNFENITKFVRLPKRLGLIQARLAGARRITAEIMVVLDAHIEVNHNWLPPLIEPIALNRNTVVVPIIDPIDGRTLKYLNNGPNFGVFSWSFVYTEVFFTPNDETAPHKNPLMMGGLFAISIDFFWHLGGYDEGLQIWGGEEYELSFKIWMCGGQLLSAPCSKVGHHFRGNLNKGMHAKVENFLFRNHKRVVEVWLDEYKEDVYTLRDIYRQIDAGDLTVQKALRKKLQCKSFKWYLNEIAVDTLKWFPPLNTVEYASGRIESVADPNLCIDTYHSGRPALFPCNRRKKTPTHSQFFLLRHSRDLRWHHLNKCFDVPRYHKNASVILYECHKLGGNQFWYYNRKKKWLVNGRKGSYCLDSLPRNRSLFINICQEDNINMKWNFEKVNDTALDRFFENIKN